MGKSSSLLTMTVNLYAGLTMSVGAMSKYFESSRSAISDNDSAISLTISLPSSSITATFELGL